MVVGVQSGISRGCPSSATGLLITPNSKPRCVHDHQTHHPWPAAADCCRKAILLHCTFLFTLALVFVLHPDRHRRSVTERSIRYERMNESDPPPQRSSNLHSACIPICTLQESSSHFGSFPHFLVKQKYKLNSIAIPLRSYECKVQKISINHFYSIQLVQSKSSDHNFRKRWSSRLR